MAAAVYVLLTTLGLALGVPLVSFFMPLNFIPSGDTGIKTEIQKYVSQEVIN